MTDGPLGAGGIKAKPPVGGAGPLWWVGSHGAAGGGTRSAVAIALMKFKFYGFLPFASLAQDQRRDGG